MLPLRAVAWGARAVNGAGRVIAWYWLVTLFFALLAALPAAGLLARNLGHSLYADRLFEQFDPQWLQEFAFETHRWPQSAAPPLLALLAAGYLLASTFLAGGALTVLGGCGTFWSGCGNNFSRLLRLLLVSGVFYGIVLALLAAAAKLSDNLWSDGMTERPVLIFFWCRIAVAILLLLFVNMAFDYAKIRMVLDGRTRAWRAALSSLRFAARHLFTTGGTYLLVCLIAAALALAWAALSAVLPGGALGWLIVVFVAQQAYVSARIAVKLLFFAAQIEVYRETGPVVTMAS